MKTISQTEKEIQQDDNTLCSLKLNNYGIALYLIYNGSKQLDYTMFLKGELLFEGSNYKPSPFNNTDDLESIVCCLAFLTVQPGDTDQDYFKDYTPAQMAFANSFDCEQIKGLISDFDNKQEDEPEYHEEAREYFLSCFNA